MPESAEERRKRLAQEALDTEFAQSGQREGEAAGTRQESLTAIRGYDPMAYARTTGSAIYADAADSLNTADQTRKARLNARGLFGSNIGGARQGRDFSKYLARATAGLGMDAAQLEGQNINRLLDVYGTDVGRAESGRDRSLEFLSGERDRDTAAANAKRAAQAQKVPWWKQVLDIGAKVIPAFL